MSRDDDAYAIFEKVCNDVYCSLEKTKKVLSPEKLQAAAEAIMNAGKIIVIGLGNSASIALDASHKLLRIGHSPEAMEYLLGGSLGTLTTASLVERKPPGPLELPKKNDTMRRVYAYLLTSFFLNFNLRNLKANYTSTKQLPSLHYNNYPTTFK